MHKRRRRIILVAFLLIEIPVVVLLFLRLLNKNGPLNLTLAYADLSFRVIAICLEVFMAVDFLNHVNFFKNKKLKKIKS